MHKLRAGLLSMAAGALLAWLGKKVVRRRAVGLAANAASNGSSNSAQQT
ncbi:MAG: hypothetical protein Q4A28_05820 [Brachymonas sp.]|nr:hypothetical protein [Brachymonas sp.]